MKNELIAKVVPREWGLFQKVESIGGRAACQDDKETFDIMRTSQLIAWSEAVLNSYLNDLTEAEMQNRNLLTEKYARMMEFTTPIAYARIQSQLPQLKQEVILLIDKIIAIHMAWTQEISVRFPNIRKRGRPVFAVDDTSNTTSLETYLRGELATYSLGTLGLYYQHALAQKEQSINAAQIVLEYMMKQYGFNSLEEANRKMQR